MRSEFPTKYRKAGDLIRIAVALWSRKYSRDEVYARIRSIISDQLGIKEQDIHPNSHFVKDLRVS